MSKQTEIAIYMLIIFLLVVGTYVRNQAYSTEMSLMVDCQKKSPNLSRTNNNLGVEYIKLGKWKEARPYLERATQLPDIVKMDVVIPGWASPVADANSNLSFVLVMLGELDNAMEHAEAAIKHYPTHANAHNNLGLVLSRKKRYGEAILEFTKAVTLDPNHEVAKKNLGAIVSLMIQKQQETATCQGPEICTTNKPNPKKEVER